MEDPFAYSLGRVPWQIFGTLTFRRASYPKGKRISMFLNFARRVCKDFNIYFPDSLWVLRRERGEQFGRVHYHFLFAGLPKSALVPSYLYTMRAYWQQITLTRKQRNGHVILGEDGQMEFMPPMQPRVRTKTDIRFFDQSLSGVDYILKGDDVYESSKFRDDTSRLTLSHGLESKLRFLAALKTDRSDTR